MFHHLAWSAIHASRGQVTPLVLPAPPLAQAQRVPAGPALEEQLQQLHLRFYGAGAPSTAQPAEAAPSAANLQQLALEQQRLQLQQRALDAERLRLEQMWQELQQQRLSLQEDVALAEASAAAAAAKPTTAISEEPQCLGLPLPDIGPWMATHLDFEVASAAAAQSSKALEVVLDVQAVWPKLRAELPPSKFGLGLMELRLGLFWGTGGDPLKLDKVELCPQVFRWKPSSFISGGSTSSRKQAEEHLTTLLEQQRHFLNETFVPWTNGAEVRTAGSQAVAWLVCNDGEAFALSEAMTHFGAAKAARGDRWRRTVVVLDRAKSSASDPALEVFDLGGETPRRRLFDMT